MTRTSYRRPRPAVNDPPGFTEWLRQFEGEESALGDLAWLSRYDEWPEHYNYYGYHNLIPSDAEDALFAAWGRFVAWHHRQERLGQHAPHVPTFRFTTKQVRGKPRLRRPPDYILDAVEAPAVGCWELPDHSDPERYPYEPDRFLQWKMALGRQVKAVVLNCVERGYPDSEIVELVSHMEAAKLRWPNRPVERFRRVSWWIREARRQHPHTGRKCDTVGCPNTPDWMVSRV